MIATGGQAYTLNYNPGVCSSTTAEPMVIFEDGTNYSETAGHNGRASRCIIDEPPRSQKRVNVSVQIFRPAFGFSYREGNESLRGSQCAAQVHRLPIRRARQRTWTGKNFKSRGIKQ